MAKKASSDLLDRLKHSLPKRPEAETPALAPAVAAAPSPTLRTNAPKLSVSLYQQDLDRLDQIKAFMQEHGFRNLSDSEALRLACRAVVIDEHFLELYRAMQDDDGRRKKTLRG